MTSRPAWLLLDLVATAIFAPLASVSVAADEALRASRSEADPADFNWSNLDPTDLGDDDPSDSILGETDEDDGEDDVAPHDEPATRRGGVNAWRARTDQRILRRLHAARQAPRSPPAT